MTSILQEESNLLFRAYQNGDTAALGELYRRWHQFVAQRVEKCNAFSTADVEDISANVWVLVQQHAHKWDVDRSGWYIFLSYKIRTAVSTELIRRKRRRKILEQHGYVEMSDVSVAYNPETLEWEHADDGDPRINSRTLGDTFYVDPEPPALETLIESERHQTLEKAIRVCQFTSVTEQILRLRLKDMTLEGIREQLNLKQTSCVRLHLQRAFEDLKEVIDPVTFEVATLAPKVRRKREKQEHLERAGCALKKCITQQSLSLMEVSRAAKINLRELRGFIKGKSRPQAPRLFRLASVLGDQIFDIYLPDLPRAHFREQGQSLWRMRAESGLSLKKISKLAGIDYSLLVQYEAGTLKIPQETVKGLTRLFSDISQSTTQV